jgi:hypothetical protein
MPIRDFQKVRDKLSGSYDRNPEIVNYLHRRICLETKFNQVSGFIWRFTGGFRSSGRRFRKVRPRSSTRRHKPRKRINHYAKIDGAFGCLYAVTLYRMASSISGQGTLGSMAEFAAIGPNY